ncbi:MAG: carboxypeptidase regulatory-like domain-containing protein [Planctomycetota bacterium]
MPRSRSYLIALLGLLGLVLAWVILDGREADRVGQRGDEGVAVDIDPCRLEGQVVRDVDGVPLAGARVELRFKDGDELGDFGFDDRDPPRTLSEAWTDEKGAFGFDVERGVQYRLRATKDGYASRAGRKLIGGAREVLRLSEPGTVEGRVLRSETGQPVAGARVTVHRDGDAEILAAARTGADGAYRLEGLPPEELIPECRVEAAMTRGPWHVIVRSGQETQADFDVDVGRSVTGQVTDVFTGEPVAGAGISSSLPDHNTTMTSREGRFELTVHDREDEVVVRASGFVPVVMPLPKGSDPLDIELRRGGIVHGRMVDANGDGIRGGQVLAGTDTGRPIHAEVDQEGYFEVAGLDPEASYMVLLRARRFGARALLLPKQIESGERLDLGNLMLETPGGVEGRVVDKDGSPFADAEVRLLGPTTPPDVPHGRDRNQSYRAVEASKRFEWWAFKGSPLMKRNALSSSNGCFWFSGLSGGTYELYVSRSPGTHEAKQVVQVSAGGISTDLVFVLDRGSFVSGRVVTADGTKLPDPSEIVLKIDCGMGWKLVTVQSDGRFRVEGLVSPEGAPCTLINVRPGLLVDGWSMMPIQRVEVGTTDLVVALSRSKPIKGRVVTGAGEPVPKVTVNVYLPGDPEPLTFADSDERGRFRVEVPPQFVGRVEAVHPDDMERDAVIDDVPAGRHDLELVVK